MNPQYFIALFGLSAVYMAMVSESQATRRWAPVVGLAGQPFWLYATSSAAQWGMFALCCAYTAIYARGAWKAWKQHGITAQGAEGVNHGN